MQQLLFKIISYIKLLIFILRPHILFGFLRNPLLFISNILGMSKWVSDNKKEATFDDFMVLNRGPRKRYELYKHVISELNLQDKPINFLEFGVCEGSSFFWWLKENKNPDTRFYGFDTFEGLPENWGIAYKKGDMYHDVPVTDDKRAQFVAGLFQETLLGFLDSNTLDNSKTNIIHIDADLFSSTLFSLATLAPYMKIGDVILFDEFSVPNHEYYAFKLFTDSFYIKTKLIGAVNNYFQTAVVVTEKPISKYSTVQTHQ